MKKKYVIIGAIVSVLTLTGLIVLALSSYNKTKPVSADETQDIQNLVMNEVNILENLVEEEVSIENLVQENTIVDVSNTKETTTKETTSKSNTNTTNTKPYYIKVNYGAQVVTIYKKDDSGNYTVPFKAMVCSTGEYTPKSGVYSIPSRWEWLRLQGYVWGHYSTQIKGNILFHSVPYLTKGDPGSLEYWEYDKLGTYASAGCVRLTVKDAKWIFDNCANGTKVEFYSSSNPGPLGKPSAKKISNAEGDLKNWDPTDPNPNNPWKNYKQQNTNKTENKTENTQNNTIVQDKDKNVVNNTQTNITQSNKNTITNTQVNNNKQESVNKVTTNTQITTDKQQSVNKVNTNKTDKINTTNTTTNTIKK